MSLRGVDPAHDRGGRGGGPVDRALGLREQRARPAGHPRAGAVERLRRGAPRGDPGHRLHDGLDRRAADLVTVQAALPRLAHRERPRRPDVATVDGRGRLEHGDAPLRGPELDRPVERRRAAIPHRAGVHDQAAMRGEDRLGDDRLQHRADDQLRPVAVHRRLHRCGGRDDGDVDLVALLLERDLHALAQAVVRRHEEQHAQAAVCEGEGGGGVHVPTATRSGARYSPGLSHPAVVRCH